MPKGQTAIELVTGNGKPFTDMFYRIQPCKIFRKHTEDKKQSVTEIRDDKIRKDGMSMFARAYKAQYAEIMTDNFSSNKVNNRAPVIGVYVAGTLSATLGTRPPLRTEAFHKEIKE